jgi:hypothetical protein
VHVLANALQMPGVLRTEVRLVEEAAAIPVLYLSVKHTPHLSNDLKESNQEVSSLVNSLIRVWSTPSFLLVTQYRRCD